MLRTCSIIFLIYIIPLLGAEESCDSQPVIVPLNKIIIFSSGEKLTFNTYISGAPVLYCEGDAVVNLYSMPHIYNYRLSADAFNPHGIALYKQQIITAMTALTCDKTNIFIDLIDYNLDSCGNLSIGDISWFQWQTADKNVILESAVIDENEDKLSFIGIVDGIRKATTRMKLKQLKR